ncbi:MAG: hypothetical protein HPY55_00910 [Firmicutes bacterium]|nr:hypothetical protein [Bacillota bacterium]
MKTRPGVQQQGSPAGAWPDPYMTRANKMLVYSNPHNQRVAPAWHNNNVVHFLDLGEVAVDPGGAALNPLYFVITGFDHAGTPVLVQGQYCIVSRLPGEPGYSQFCRVCFLEAPAIYMPNTVRSEEDAKASGYPILETDMVLCAPVL